VREGAEGEGGARKRYRSGPNAPYVEDDEQANSAMQNLNHRQWYIGKL